jgi:hypothetical protein
MLLLHRLVLGGTPPVRLTHSNHASDGAGDPTDSADDLLPKVAGS